MGIMSEIYVELHNLQADYDAGAHKRRNHHISFNKLAAFLWKNCGYSKGDAVLTAFKILNQPFHSERLERSKEALDVITNFDTIHLSPELVEYFRS